MFMVSEIVTLKILNKIKITNRIVDKNYWFKNDNAGHCINKMVDRL